MILRTLQTILLLAALIQALQYTHIVVRPDLVNNYPALYSGFCEKYVPGFDVPPEWLETDRQQLLERLQLYKRPVVNQPYSPLDVEILPGKYLKCGKDGVEAPILKATAAFDSCEYVMVTSIFGGRDVLPPLPAKAPRDICYVAFLDKASMILNQYQADGTVGGWSIVQVDPEWMPFESARENSRIPKQLLPRLFPHAEWSIWIDSKLKLIEEPLKFVNEHLLYWGSFMSLFMHHLRLSWFEEQKAVLQLRLGEPEVIARQEADYSAMGLTKDFQGLVDGAVIFRDHRHLLSHVLSCLWWNEYIEYPPRDQTSFTFAHTVLGFRPTMSPAAFASVRDRGGSQLRKLWHNYYSNLTLAPLHAAARCRMDYAVRRVGHARKVGLSSLLPKGVRPGDLGMTDARGGDGGAMQGVHQEGKRGGEDGTGMQNRLRDHLDFGEAARRRSDDPHPLQHLLPGN